MKMSRFRWQGKRLFWGLEPLEARKLLTVTYSVTDLGFLSSNYGVVFGINDSGQIVGGAINPSDGSSHAVLFSNGAWTELPGLGGNNSFATAINDAGQIVGDSETGALDINKQPIFHAFLYSDGTSTDLGTFGGDDSIAYGINSSGQIVGIADLFPGVGDDSRAFLYSNGSMTSLGTLGGSFSYAQGINNSGQIIGTSELSSPSNIAPLSLAFLYSNGVMTSLGALGGGFSNAMAINSSGQVVGCAQLADGYYHAFLYSDGTLNDLGTLGGTESQAADINDSGQVVGVSNLNGSNAESAFIYTDGKMYNLNDLIPPNSGVTLHTAYAINNSGQIVAMGPNSSGEIDTYLLTPLPPQTPTVISADNYTLHSHWEKRPHIRSNPSVRLWPRCPNPARFRLEFPSSTTATAPRPWPERHWREATELTQSPSSPTTASASPAARLPTLLFLAIQSPGLAGATTPTGTNRGTGPTSRCPISLTTPRSITLFRPSRSAAVHSAWTRSNPMLPSTSPPADRFPSWRPRALKAH
jgi:probable HAF family extracellular repeat protein